MQADGFEELLADRVDRVEAGHGLRKIMAISPPRTWRRRSGLSLSRSISPVSDWNAMDPRSTRGWAWDEMEQAHRGDALAATRFAHDRDGLFRVNGEVCAVDGLMRGPEPLSKETARSSMRSSGLVVSLVLGLVHLRALLGSKASRRPSPTKLSEQSARAGCRGTRASTTRSDAY